jgi:far upstream element-binding protein
MVPTSKCGLIIGKGGETIKNINQTSGAHCEVDKNAPPDAREKNFIIRGSPEAVERAKAMIMEKLGMQGGGGGYGGPPSAGYGGSWSAQYPTPTAGGYPPDSTGVNPQAGQHDYSAQWVEYYRSMGMTREAEAIEQQMRAARAPSAPAAAPAPAANGAANGAADYSAQWIDYYRSIGKHDEAKAIELQMKQKAAATQGYAPPGAQFPGAGYYGGAQPQAASTYPGYPGYGGYGQPTGADA